MNDVHFAAPGWIHGLWGVLALVATLLVLERRSRTATERVLGPAMRDRLVAAPSATRRRLGIVLLGLCGSCLVIGLMQPQWGLRHITTPRVGAEIMVALDVSRSMLAEDVAPNRLSRAKAEVADLLTFLDGDQVGLIAFAGRASVLSPLTPDFGFFRMVLDSAGPQSVTRGGTRLAEPIRKAVAGFGPGGEASRGILLITDGEDHDSFALDAAREAAEAGVKIIAIGFGDEAGSQIPITDPVTGARTLVLDADGKPVRSRLDGELLREIALATGGAYVPAGTGVLDLESIYERHIARLTRGRLEARGRTVRDERYQWVVLLGLLFLVSSVLVAAGPVTRCAVAAALLLAPLGGPPASAEEAPQSPQAEAPLPSENGGERPSKAEPEKPKPEPEEPRALYNLGVAALDRGEGEEATRLLERARTQAGADGELRFRASYNLGMAEAANAEALEAERPAEALASLNRAAAWFSEAVQQRGDHEDSRHNLEVTLRRALLLEDRLAREGKGDLEQELAEMAERQRGLVAATAALLERTDSEARSDPHAVDRYRREFGGQATAQRTLLADADALASRVAAEAAVLESGSEKERKPAERMRAAQLASVLGHLHSAREQMGQARSQLRRRQGERAYRRSAAALQELKRARDPLRDPVSLLDAVISDASEVAAATELLAAAGREIPGLAEPFAPPAWVSRGTLRESQSAIAERAGELHARLRAGLGSAAPGTDLKTSEVLARVEEAEPFVGKAREQLEAASVEIERGALDTARSAQRDAIAALLEARERFLDLRGLIEATYAAQRRIQGVLHGEQEADASLHGEYLPSLRAAQESNLERGRRVGEMLEHGAGLGGFEGSAGEGGDAPRATQEQEERMLLARAALQGATSAMGDVERALARGSAGWGAAASAAEVAVSRLEALRRLFFSISDQLRDLTERQVDLADLTQDAAALEDASPPERRSEALAPRQKTLAARTGEVALELAKQSDEAAEAADAPDAAETSRRLRLAGEHALAAEDAMNDAAQDLGAEPPVVSDALSGQKKAIQELGEALALLAPPQAQEGEGPGQGKSPEESSGGSEKNDEEARAATVDPAQLLQTVRDQEAQRRRDRSRAPRAGYEPVEKDW